MKKIKLFGKIERSYIGLFETIILVQDDGYKIDLIGRLREVEINSIDGMVQINYHTSDVYLTEHSYVENHILSISGALTAEYEANGYSYSSMTSGTDYETILTVGKHNLFNELMSFNGKFAFFEINYK